MKRNLGRISLAFILIAAGMAVFQNCAGPASGTSINDSTEVVTEEPTPVEPTDPSDPDPDPIVPDPVVTFTFKSATQISCPRAADWCTQNWPTSGRVFKYTFDERHTGVTAPIVRTAYVYRPTDGTTVLPLLVHLHGGGGEALNQFAKFRFTKLASAQGSTPGQNWSKNTDTCKYKNSVDKFRTSSNAVCTPQTVNFKNTQRFYVVYPDGVLDPGSTTSRHWEDGRVPSPGFGGAQEHRDDVGFINALISTVSSRETGRINGNRIYISGVSNGGMMAQRLACHSNDNKYPQLKKVAAYAAIVAALPHRLKTGEDRPRCPTSTTNPFSMLFIAGDGLPTPTSTISGDGIMPYGNKGNTYSVNSPNGGAVIAMDDSVSHWLNLLKTDSGEPTTVSGNPKGFYSNILTHSITNRHEQVKMIVTDGGEHDTSSTRMDFNVNGQILRFFLSFRRDNGQILYTTPSALTGTY